MTAALTGFSHDPRENGFVCIWPIYQGVDRTQGTGMVIKDDAAGKRLQVRYKNAFATLADRELREKGSLEIKTDVYGKTYVAFHVPVIGRSLNADLKRLGF